MIPVVKTPDLAIVGGGIAGASLATVMARAGADVVVLERQTSYGDHVRGELLWPWGIAEARALGIESILLAAGANRAATLESHDEGRAKPHREPIAGVDEAGSLNLAHPTACAALASAAADAGAEVVFGVRDVTVTNGAEPAIEFVHRGRRRALRPRLVVGADGRTSRVRRIARIPLEIDEPAHLVAGLLVEGAEGADSDADVVARERDLLFLAFPQGDGRARLYHCFPTAQRDRFAGPEAALRFLAACQLACLPSSESWSGAQPAGPCATFPASDARAATPLAPGIVLVGDAAGYENPLLGQGLAMALRDVRDVTDVLTGATAWTSEIFSGYAHDRARRHHIAKLATLLDVWFSDGFEIQDPAVRAERRARIDGDGLLAALDGSTWNGYDGFGDVPTDTELRERIAS